jgi:prephenate dehydrogenase
MRTLTASGFRDMTRLAQGSAAMHRDILITNAEAVTRWIDQFSDELASLRALIVDQSPDNREKALTDYFARARDKRAEWATQTTREGQLLQQTGSDVAMGNVGDQMTRMFFGGLFRRRMAEAERMGRKRGRRVQAGDSQGTRDQSSGRE